MILFWKIWLVLFSWNTRFEIRPFPLLPGPGSIHMITFKIRALGFLPNMSLYWLLGFYDVGLRFNLLDLNFFLLFLYLSLIFVFFSICLVLCDCCDLICSMHCYLLIGFFYIFLLFYYYFFCVLFQNFSLVSRFIVCIGHVLELLICIDVIQGNLC